MTAADVPGQYRRHLPAFRTYLCAPVATESLSLFRILFGVLMMWEVIRYWRDGRLERDYIEPEFFFKFIEPLPTLGEGAVPVFIVMFAAALFLAIGYAYRAAAIVFFLLYTYVFLIDKTQYNNHYYLISLLALLFSVTGANRTLSLDACCRTLPSQAPRWHVLIFRFQIFIVFFYAGVAKINGDWLAGEPVREWLKARSDYVLIGQFLTEEWFVYCYAYAGMTFDLAIGFLLVCRRTRPWTLPPLMIFSAMNMWFYDIGIFPYLTTAVWILFVDDALRFWPSRLRPEHRPLAGYRLKPLVGVLVGGFALLQVLYPLLHFAIPGNVSWTDEGHNFAWHMKLRDKNAEEFYFYTNTTSGVPRKLPVDDLTDRQIWRMMTRPHMIIQYAHHLGEQLAAAGQDPNVHVRAIVSLNYRHRGPLIDERIDLTDARYSLFSHNDWIVIAPGQQ